MRFYSIIKHDLISKKYFYLDYGGGYFTHTYVSASRFQIRIDPIEF